VTDTEQQAIVIVKRHHSHEDAHHGGAWKIAFADFMTAMMALFLVLWLISSTSEKTKHAVAQYFNPVKLVDVTTLKKGFRDPKNTEMAAGPKSHESSPEADTNQSLAETREVVQQPGAKMPTRSESTLFRDPYAALTEIAAAARADVMEGEKFKGASGPAETAAADASPDSFAIFRDPFATIPREPDAAARSDATASFQDLPASQAAAAALAIRKDQSAPAVAHDAPASRPETEARLRGASALEPADPAADAPKPGEADAARLKAAVAALVKADARPESGPKIEVQSTSEGVLISLTDNGNFSMFAVGSAEPQPKTVEIMARIGGLLKTRAGAIVIRGHTDARPFKSASYDNWRLSAARAHMAHYMLIRGGLDEQRIEKIEGYADRRLKTPQDPLGAVNRRIEILVRKEKP
jgi:chemotaxis protein MotB